jgi:hypothetical protein
MSLLTAYSLLRDALFKAGEPTDGTSEYHDKALDMLNRAQYTACFAGGDLVPGLDENWDWLKKYPPGVFLLKPAHTRSATFTQGSAAGTFAVAPSGSFESGWFIKTPNGKSYRVITHIAASTAFTLDTEFIEASGTYTITVMKFEYYLGDDVMKVVSPMRMHGFSSEDCKITGSAVDQMTSDYGNVPLGTPEKFSIVEERRVRMSHCLPTTSEEVRVEFDYLYLPDDLTDSINSSPVLPAPHRKILSDITAMWLLEMKNDSRAADYKSLAVTGLQNMQLEQKKGRSHLGPNFGRFLKSRGKKRGPLRTESGIIIG